ncbi:helix-turn-helix domain-containing protein, partial [Pseudodesulfovibrio sp. JC047]|uniref:helix-turn-helix domain-containing protein n=1 Tax=Pseudodesulfovibrio sp. JC047 TaxID=2683199 RepID=UPI0013D20B83
MTKLKELLDICGLSQRDLARGLDLSPAAVSDIVNHDRWPKKTKKTDLQAAIRKELRKVNANKNKVKHLFRKSRAKEKTKSVESKTKEESIMLLRMQGLFPETKRHFGLMDNPFGEVQGHKDVFLSNEIRYVREALYHTARHGGFMAIVGESGSGKSTLRRDLIDRIAR